MRSRKAVETVDFSFDAPRPSPQRSAPSPRPVRPRRRSQEEIRREKRAKFKQIMTPRVNKAIHDISLLVHGSNRKRYHFTPDDVQTLREVLHAEVDKALAPYVNIEKPSEIEFKD